MTHHYWTRDFFRQMPSALLARYFATRGLLTDFGLTAVKEGKIDALFDALFDAWMALPEAARVRLCVRYGIWLARRQARHSR